MAGGERFDFRERVAGTRGYTSIWMRRLAHAFIAAAAFRYVEKIFARVSAKGDRKVRWPFPGKK